MGKKMKNAPVYYTLAQARHNPILRLGAYVPDIQDRMRKAGFPDHQRTSTLVVPLLFGAPPEGQTDAQRTLPRPSERHLFLSSDGSHGFIVEESSLSFQTTEYDTFEPFLDAFLTGFGIVHECIKLDYIERVGIRYLDAVIPPEDSPDDLLKFLNPGVLGLAGHMPEGVSIGLSVSETHIPLADANLLSRTIVRSGPLGFPMDLEPQGLTVPQRFKQLNGLHAIIDTDASQTGRRDVDLASLRDLMVMLHDKIRMAFEATVTKHALAVWQ
ncbi:MAG: TIGR04255 family protein [Burkholderiaceae bacterium]|nr:TIGR04255 family protein [Burkholderiaceae bacterium]